MLDETEVDFKIIFFNFCLLTLFFNFRMSIFKGNLDGSLSLLTCLTLTRLAISLTVHRRIPFEVLSKLASLESQQHTPHFFMISLLPSTL